MPSVTRYTWGYAIGKWPWGGRPVAGGPGSTTLEPSPIASTTRLGLPSLAPISQALLPPSIGSTTALGLPTLEIGDVTLFLPSIRSVARFGLPRLSGGAAPPQHQYSTGTIDLVAGSASVTGIATAWTGNVSAGHLLVVLEPGTPAADAAYRISAVGGDEALTLRAPWPGPSLEGIPYVVHTDLDGRGVPRLDRADRGTPQLWNHAMMLIDDAIPIV